jgi:hypothetical protein
MAVLSTRQRAAALVVTAALAAIAVAWIPAPAAAQISPGPLSSAHQALEGNRGCPQCHQAKRGVSAELCLSCHQPIADRLEKRRGLHARPEYAACESCHIEHQGREFELIWWGERGQRSFDHRLTGQPLIGAHARLACRDCHQPGKIVEKQALQDAGTPLATTFLGLGTNCQDCHADEHRGQFPGKSCITCHDQNRWQPASRFDHAQTGFALTGKHRPLECVACHAGIDAPAEPPLQFSGVAFNSCASCHRDPHQGRLGNRCASCHNTGGWRAVETNAMDHDRTRFPLRGLHARVACESCHRDGRMAVESFERCASCHADVHLGQFRDRADGGTCESCHDVDGFSPAHFSPADHDITRYPLAGAHRAIACVSCHREEPAEEVATWSDPAARTAPRAGTKPTRRFRFTDLTCEGCHRDPHDLADLADLAPSAPANTSELACLSCHSQDSWHDVAFDHQRTSFPLAGAHLRLECASCHVRAQAEGEPLTIPFTGAPSTCAGCHQDPHAGQFARAGAAAEPATTCTRCHTESDWRATLFDHGRDSRYLLEGAHTRVACGGCHPAEARGGTEVVRYRPLKSECTDCHGGGGS